MICPSCLAYNNNERIFCKSCGIRLEESGGAKPSKKPKYYCKRCRRHLVSKICPMHGMEHMVSIDTPEPVQAESNGNWEKARDSSGMRATPLPPPEEYRDLIDTVPPKSNGSAKPEVVIARENPNEDIPVDSGGTMPAETSAQETIDPIIDDELQSTLRSLIESRLESLRKERVEQTKSRPAPAKPKPKPTKTVPATASNGRAQTNGATPPQPKTTAQKSQATQTQPVSKASVKATPRRRRAQRRRRLSPLQMAAAVLIPVFLVASGVFLYAFFQPTHTAAALFASAQDELKNGNINAASQLFLQVQSAFPGDSLAQAAALKISEIAARQTEEMKKRDQVLNLMSQASEAFSRNQFLDPQEKSAVTYINQILEIDPNFQPAQKMREQIITHYFDAARLAFESGNYEEAAQSYQDILKITPNDPQVLDEMETALKAHSVQKMLDDLNELASTQEEVKKLQKQKFRLKSQVKAERRKLNTASASGATSGIELPKKGVLKPSKGARKPRNVLSKTTSEPANIPIAQPEKADPNAPLVDEDRIDGGRKRYFRQPAPSIPANLAGKSSGIILAECLVNTLGEVESVTIVSPSEEAAFNKLAEQLLKQYRYKPATFKGKPTRFKAVEVLSF